MLRWMIPFLLILVAASPRSGRASDPSDSKLPDLVSVDIESPPKMDGADILGFLTPTLGGAVFHMGRGQFKDLITGQLMANPMIHNAEVDAEIAAETSKASNGRNMTLGQFKKHVLKTVAKQDAAFADKMIIEMERALKINPAMTLADYLSNKAKPIQIGDLAYASQIMVRDTLDRVVNVIFDKFQIKPERSHLWVEKLSQPFKACTAAAVKANTYDDIGLCLIKFAKSAEDNIGLAITYEVSRANLAAVSTDPHFLACRAQDYDSCLIQVQQQKIALLGGKTKASAQDRINIPAPVSSRCTKEPFQPPSVRSLDQSGVEGCALTSIKNGVYDVSAPLVKQTISSQVSSPAQSAPIIQSLQSHLKSCLGSLNATAGAKDFMDCADQVEKEGGQALVPVLVQTNPQVVSVTTDAERKDLAQKALDRFTVCTDRQIRDQVRLPSGMLNIDACQADVMSFVTEDVVLKVFPKVLGEQFGKQSAITQSLLKDSTNFLQKCWPTQISTATQKADIQTENSCLRNSVLHLINGIASKQLDSQVPADFQASNPGFKAKALSQLTACIGKVLPAQMTDGFNPNDTKILKCENDLGTSSALTIARWEVQGVLKGRVTPARANQLSDQFVDRDFRRCLGPAPTPAKVSECEVKLVKGLGQQVAVDIMPAQLDDFVNQNGGLKTLGMTPQDRARILTTLNQTSSSCIQKMPEAANGASLSLDDSISSLMGCFKETAGAFAQNIANFEFDKKAAPVLKGDPKVLEQQRTQMNQTLQNCLNLKRDKQASLDDYINNEKDICAPSVMSALVGSVGQAFGGIFDRQINQVIDQYQACLKSGQTLSKCDQLLSSLLETLIKGTLGTIKEAGVLEPQGSCQPVSDPKLANVATDLAKASLMAAIQDNPEAARTGFASLLKDLSGFFGSDPDSKKGVARQLAGDSKLDPLIISAIRNVVSGSIEGLSGDTKLPDAVKRQILSPSNFSSIFNPEVMKTLRSDIAGELGPAIEGKPVSAESMMHIKKKVAGVLLKSPTFGSIIAKTEIQQQIKSTVKSYGMLSSLARVVASVQGKCLNWSTIKSETLRSQAESCVIDEIIMPMMENNDAPVAPVATSTIPCMKAVNDAMGSGCARPRK